MILVRLLRFAFKLLYHQFAWTYDAVAWLVSAGQWKKWVLAMAPLVEGSDPVLEVGHGPGHLLERLLRDGRRVVGVDLSPQMGRRARRRLARLRLPVDLVRADALTLPFSERAFGAVVATFPAGYIADRAAWESFARVLAPGGRVVVLLGANPIGNAPLRVASRLLFRLTRQAPPAPEEVLRTRFVEKLSGSGLAIEFKQVQINRSSLYYLIGKKELNRSEK